MEAFINKPYAIGWDVAGWSSKQYFAAYNGRTFVLFPGVIMSQNKTGWPFKNESCNKYLKDALLWGVDAPLDFPLMFKAFLGRLEEPDSNQFVLGNKNLLGYRQAEYHIKAKLKLEKMPLSSTQSFLTSPAMVAQIKMKEWGLEDRAKVDNGKMYEVYPATIKNQESTIDAIRKLLPCDLLKKILETVYREENAKKNQKSYHQVDACIAAYIAWHVYGKEKACFESPLANPEQLKKIANQEGWILFLDLAISV